MSLSFHAASVPLFQQMLGSLKHILAKAADHAEAKKIEPQALLGARLAPDMFPLTRQVQIACDFAKGVSARLAGVEVPVHEDKEQSFAELIARIDTVLAFIGTLPTAAFAGAEDRDIVLRPGTAKEMRFSGQDYLFRYGIPQFFFHMTSSYALLRHNGVEIGKRDFMGM